MEGFMSIQPYGQIKQLAEDVFCVEGDWYGSVFKRRMTILRLSGGELMVHSPIRLMDPDYGLLDQLGELRTIIVPNSLHCDEAHFYKQRYPQAALLVSQGARKKVEKMCHIDGLLPDSWDQKVKSQVECLEILGTRGLHENVFLHKKSRTLVLTDLVFHMTAPVKGAAKLFFQLNKIYQRFGPSRVFRYLFVSHLQQVSSSIEILLRWDFDRVIMSHGEVLDAGGKEALRQGFAELGFILTEQEVLPHR